jgi:hypothetical protein
MNALSRIPRYCCSFCLPVPEVYVTGFLGFTERDSLLSTPACLVWLHTPGSHFPWLVCYICALCSLCQLLFPCPLVVWVPTRWCSGNTACFINCVLCLSARVVQQGLPSLFCLGTAQCFCIRVCFVYINKKPYCVFLCLSPYPLYQRDITHLFSYHYITGCIITLPYGT